MAIVVILIFVIAPIAVKLIDTMIISKEIYWKVLGTDKKEGAPLYEKCSPATSPAARMAIGVKYRARMESSDGICYAVRVKRQDGVMMEMWVFKKDVISEKREVLIPEQYYTPVQKSTKPPLIPRIKGL